MSTSQRLFLVVHLYCFMEQSTFIIEAFVAVWFFIQGMNGVLRDEALLKLQAPTLFVQVIYDL